MQEHKLDLGLEFRYIEEGALYSCVFPEDATGMLYVNPNSTK
jgi:hypothetical protein